MCHAHLTLERACGAIGKYFQWDRSLGYLTANPANCGTCMRCSVHLKVPRVAEHKDFHRLLTHLRLVSKGSNIGGVCDVSNVERIGRTEVQLVMGVGRGAALLVELERQAEQGSLPKQLPIPDMDTLLSGSHGGVGSHDMSRLGHWNHMRY